MKIARIYRAQGLNPDTGVFTEIPFDRLDSAKQVAGILVYGEVREISTNKKVYESEV